MERIRHNGFRAVRMEEPDSDRKFVFRVPDLDDIFELDESVPLLDVERARVRSDLAGSFGDVKLYRKLTRRWTRLLVLCALDPVLVDVPQADPVPEGAVNARTIRAEHRALFGELLMAEAGYGLEREARELRPTSGDDTSQAPSTSSPGGTDASPASSSSAPAGAGSPGTNG